MEVVSEVSFTADLEYRKLATVPGAADQIIALAPELAQHKLKVQAIIKRLIHAEKADVYIRVLRNLDLFARERDLLELKIKTHKELFKKPDEEIITWKVD